MNNLQYYEEVKPSYMFWRIFNLGNVNSQIDIMLGKNKTIKDKI